MLGPDGDCTGIPGCGVDEGCLWRIDVNICSMPGLIGFGDTFAYLAPKRALCGMTKAAALELVERCIQVNAILTGETDTPFSSRIGRPFAPSLRPSAAGLSRPRTQSRSCSSPRAESAI
ncbi:SDR family NAD(P)-dependent oxidoreductase [Streptomyces sp. NPDC051322]|uniref:SDR family NAD(P)-dependent oxidoreductase n=1 Tax=Streptomyces sp. NPDC051322 TaxID=3154645 RepID=UPI00344CEA0C